MLKGQSMGGGGVYCMREKGCRRERPQLKQGLWVGVTSWWSMRQADQRKKGKAHSLDLFEKTFKKLGSPDWCGSVGWVLPAKQKVAGSIPIRFPIRAYAWVVGPIPGSGICERQPFNVSLPSFLPPFSISVKKENNNNKIFIKEKCGQCPGPCDSVGWRMSHGPRLQVQSLVRECMRRQPINVSLSHWCFSPSLSLPSPLSKSNEKKSLGEDFKKSVDRVTRINEARPPSNRGKPSALGGWGVEERTWHYQNLVLCWSPGREGGTLLSAKKAQYRDKWVGACYEIENIFMH